MEGYRAFPFFFVAPYRSPVAWICSQITSDVLSAESLRRGKQGEQGIFGPANCKGKKKHGYGVRRTLKLVVRSIACGYGLCSLTCWLSLYRYHAPVILIRY